MSEIIKKLKKSKDFIDTASNLTTEELEEAITFARDKYFNTTKPILTDSLYDILIDFLTMKAPKSSVIKEVGAMVKKNAKNKVKLDYWLGSMDKIKPPSTQLANWVKKYKPPYNISDKLDGISALLVYHNDTIKMMTRGTATEGTDISNLIKYLNLPDYNTVMLYCKKNKIKGGKNMIAFRGELIIQEEVFNKQFSSKLKNVRNSVAGLVNSKTINPDLANATELVLYEVVEPFYPIEKQLYIISDIGFKVVNNMTINNELSFDYLSKYLKTRREKSVYNIDGIIITACDKQERNTDGNPDYAFAYKDIMEDQIGKTTIEDIEWNVSKDGYMKPTILLKPITIGSVLIKRATGNNAKFIVDNMLGPGAIIEIIRSGDVIPKVHKIIKKAESASLPKGTWHWNETKVDIIVNDINNNDDVLVKNIYYFFSSLDTKGLGEKNVIKLISTGYDSIANILEASYDDLIKSGFGEKTADNLVKSIKKAMANIKLAKLMAASNKLGHGMGEERMKQILNVYPNLLTVYKKWSDKEFINNIININGWEEKTAKLFVSNFDEFIKFYDSIKKYITLEETKIKIKKGVFTNKTIVFSSFRDSNMASLIENMGGKIGTSVSKNTDYLIVLDQSVLDNMTEKIKKAVELGITILTRDKLEKMLS